MKWLTLFFKLIAWSIGITISLILCTIMAGAIALAIAYPNLPDVSELLDYKPKLPLRIYTSEGELIGEFGQERRQLVPINEIPKEVKEAVLAVEDARFYQHSGIDYIGVARAALANLGRSKSQGASTITMQVARNVYLSSEKTYTRKIYEMLLTLKLEHLLTKDQILEVYMNQIFMGHRAHGFASAAETYFGKPIKEISIAEAAMLAGIPKAPTTSNPIANFAKAKERQLHVISRMQEVGFITTEQAEAARKEEIHIQPPKDETKIHASYIAEMVRQIIFNQYGEQTYTRGLNVYTSINLKDQNAAYTALRQGLLNYDAKQRWRGPEKFVEIPEELQNDHDFFKATIEKTLLTYPQIKNMQAAVVLEASSSQVKAIIANGETITMKGSALRAAQSGLTAKASPKLKIRKGAIIRVAKTNSKDAPYKIIQIPEVEGALVALDPRNGAIKALIGGFDFEKNKFNHATQAWRQPGSTFKPFIYSASLEKGFSPATMINDTPLFYSASKTGGQPWEPKNYEGGFQGPMTMRTALTRSRNIVSIRILENITPQYAQSWVSRFGFEPKRTPAYLTMALGASSVTPMQMAAGFAVFANGGYKVDPFLITRVTDHTGKVLIQTQPSAPTQEQRAIPARNAYITASMLQDVARVGTAAKASAQLKRSDIYGKTGTTNDSYDAWFAGYQPTLVSVVWVGYDTPRNLGAKETGGGLSLPIWINFMQQALKGVPVTQPPAPEGIIKQNGDWFYTENANGGGIRNLDGAGLDIDGEYDDEDDNFGSSSLQTAPQPSTPRPAGQSQERNRILDLFAN